MDFIHDDKPSLNILRRTVPIPVHDLKIKLTDFDFFLFFLLNLYSVSCCKAFIDFNHVWYEWI